MSSEIPLEETAEGVLLPVLAKPKASRNAILGALAGRLKVAVTTVPEKGKANDAILRLLAKSLNLRGSQVELASGETNQRKFVLVRGISVEELRGRIAGHL